MIILLLGDTDKGGTRCFFDVPVNFAVRFCCGACWLLCLFFFLSFGWVTGLKAQAWRLYQGKDINWQCLCQPCHKNCHKKTVNQTAHQCWDEGGHHKSWFLGSKQGKEPWVWPQIVIFLPSKSPRRRRWKSGIPPQRVRKMPWSQGGGETLYEKMTVWHAIVSPRLQTRLAV
jgi:hypothetical protein